MMEVDEEHVSTLLAMGFSDPFSVRRALSLAKGDLGDAVSFLTNETPGLGLQREGRDGSGGGGGGDDEDVEMKTVSGRDALPAYDDLGDAEDENGNGTGVPTFPAACLYDLESRVFTEQWSIPYKRNESLGRCLSAATRLAKHDLLDSDESCKRFIERCMPEAFKKLLTSSAVHKWGSEIQEGILHMLLLLVQLTAETLTSKNTSCFLLTSLSLALNPENEFHFKNRAKTSQTPRFSSSSSSSTSSQDEPPFAESSPGKEPYGWLVDLINKFAEVGGFHAIKAKAETEDLDLTTMASILQPLGMCAEFLNPTVMKTMFNPVVEKVMASIKNLDEKDLKDKRLASVPSLLSSLKLLCLRLSAEAAQQVDLLRLDTLLRLLRSPHFNAKMTSLKEVSRLLEDSSSARAPRDVMAREQLLSWLEQQHVLSLALEGNIDQAQYCDRVKGIIDALGSKLTLDEIASLWKMQMGQSTTVMDNIHSILASSATHLGNQQLHHLFDLIHQSWDSESDRVRQKLLTLIGRIGREGRSESTTSKVLDLLWEFSHEQSLPCSLVQQALSEHMAVCCEPYSTRDALKRSFALRCVEDLKKGILVVPLLRHLHDMVKSLLEHSYQKQEKGIIQELKKHVDMVKMVTGSLVATHKIAVGSSAPGALDGSVLVDGRYSHRDHVEAHLKFLAFYLQVAALYLSQNRANDIWDCLVSNPNACDSDRELCLEWFTRGLHDLEPDTQQRLFKDKILRLEPLEMSMNAFNLFKAFFESVNMNEHRLKKQTGQMLVEKPELMGIDFIWRVAMDTSDDDIANEAINLIISYGFTCLNPRLKKDPSSLHKKFFSECQKRLEVASGGLNCVPSVSHVLGRATRTLTATASPELSSTVDAPSRVRRVLTLERLLLLAERYIVTIEDSSADAFPRTLLPHGASFNGHPITLNVSCDATGTSFTLEAHGNETVISVRARVAAHIGCSQDVLQIFANDTLLTSSRNHKLLRQLHFAERQQLGAKVATGSATSTSSAGGGGGGAAAATTDTPATGSAYMMDQDSRVKEREPSTRLSQESSFSKQSSNSTQEKSLPGVVMALGQPMFDLLYQLANIDEPRLTVRVRNLLLLIPTDPSVQDTLDALGRKSSDGRCNSIQALGSVLESLFRFSATGMSTFRVLYNLEVLSSKLMPLSQDEMARNCARSFCEGFVQAGGLNLVVGVMERDTLPADTDYETRQDIYSICLQLARFLLVGLPLDNNLPDDIAMETNDGRPSPSARPARTAHSLRTNTNTSPSTPSSSSSPTSSPATGSMCSTNASSSPFSTASGAQPVTPPTRLSVGGGGGTGTQSSSDRASIRINDVHPAARAAIQTMESSDFASAVSCLVRVSWAAAAGRLDLSGTTPLSDSGAIYMRGGLGGGRRSRQSSTGSTGSSGSELGDPSGVLQAGVCVRQLAVASKDARVSIEALSLLVTCLQLRSSLIGAFYSVPCVSDFIIDILLCSPSEEVRRAACDELYALSCTSCPITGGVAGSDTSQCQKPLLFLLRVILQARLPLWTPAGTLRGHHQRLLAQCKEYFDLRCRLLEDMTESDMELLEVSPVAMLGDEITWLDNYEPPAALWEGGDGGSGTSVAVHSGTSLLAGHLRLINTLLLLSTQDKDQIGPHLIRQLLETFLFPAAKIIETTQKEEAPGPPSQHNFNPRCCSAESRLAACEVLVTLADSSLNNLQLLCSELLSLHHQVEPSLAKEFEYLPPVDGRSESGFVGLRNGGATCYMNAVFQQLYMHPGLPEAILAVEGDDAENPDESVFYQVQSLFGHLMESKLQYYVPQTFWKIFRLWNRPLLIRDQQDAYEFFTSIIDQIDEHLKKLGKEQIFKNTFQGVFSDQKICKDCPHRYEREELFVALDLGVTGGSSLEVCLDQFVRGELLEGDNSYYCEKCCLKRTTVKRMCIKSLPELLVIHLMRFGFDWDSGRPIKYDEQIRFPFLLNMEPYTTIGLARQESSNSGSSSSSSSNNGSGGNNSSNSGSNGGCNSTGSNGSAVSSVGAVLNGSSPAGPGGAAGSLNDQYELVGIVVHSGQAHAGHYYSFIKERRPGPAHGRWFRFNDTQVEGFEMSEEALEYECFGGEYRTKVYDQHNSASDLRRRYWNAYMLFYQRTGASNATSATPNISVTTTTSTTAISPVLPKKSRVSTSSISSSGSGLGSNALSDSGSGIGVTSTPGSNAAPGSRQGFLPGVVAAVAGAAASPDLSPTSSPRPPRANDGLSLLARLVRRWERTGMLGERMPPSICQAVLEENLKFMKNREVYNQNYFKFIRALASVNVNKGKHPDFEEMATVSLRLAVNFLFNTFLHTKKKLWEDVDEWMMLVGSLLCRSSRACEWLLETMRSTDGHETIRLLLLECGVREVRSHMANILEKTLEGGLQHKDSQVVQGLKKLVDSLLDLLDKDVMENCKNCAQYFRLLELFARKGPTACQLLLDLSAFRRLISFLLGPGPQPNQNRHWTMSQTREFSGLHSCLAFIILHCDVSSQATVEPGTTVVGSTSLEAPSPNTLLTLPEDIAQLLFTNSNQAYIREVIIALRKLPSVVTTLMQALCYLCFCNEQFSATVLQQIKSQLETAPPNELKSIFQLLHEILMIEDPLQTERLKFTFERERGLLAFMLQTSTTDSSRCYQCIKFIMGLAQRCVSAKEYFRGDTYHLSWTVQWLQKKMSDQYYAPQTDISNETSIGKAFQRTMSAQDTLAGITALLNEKDAAGTASVFEDEAEVSTDSTQRTSQQTPGSPSKISDTDITDIDP